MLSYDIFSDFMVNFSFNNGFVFAAPAPSFSTPSLDATSIQNVVLSYGHFVPSAAALRFFIQVFQQSRELPPAEATPIQFRSDSDLVCH